MAAMATIDDLQTISATLVVQSRATSFKNPNLKPNKQPKIKRQNKVLKTSPTEKLRSRCRNRAGALAQLYPLNESHVKLKKQSK